MADPSPLAQAIPAALPARRRGIPPVLDDGHALALAAAAQARPASRHAEALARLCPPRFRPVPTLDDLEPGVRAEVAAWLAELDRPRPGSLLLLGPLGVGKTHAALAAGRAAVLEHGRRVVFCPVASMLDALRPGGAGGVADYTAPDVLLADDLGAERPSEWVVERLYVVANERWLACRPAIVTSNLTPEELADAIGPRTWDRLRDGARAVALSGPSRRRARAC